MAESGGSVVLAQRVTSAPHPTTCLWQPQGSRWSGRRQRSGWKGREGQQPPASQGLRSHHRLGHSLPLRCFRPATHTQAGTFRMNSQSGSQEMTRSSSRYGRKSRSSASTGAATPAAGLSLGLRLSTREDRNSPPSDVPHPTAAGVHDIRAARRATRAPFVSSGYPRD